MTGRLLTAEDVAELIGMRIDYVYALARRDEIPHLRFGRTLRFRADAIDEWLEESETPGQGDRVGNPRVARRRGESNPGRGMYGERYTS